VAEVGRAVSVPEQTPSPQKADSLRQTVMVLVEVVTTWGEVVVVYPEALALKL